MSEDAIKKEVVTEEEAAAKDEAATAKNEELNADTLDQVSGGQRAGVEALESQAPVASRFRI